MTIVFPDFSKSKVLVVGDVMLDRYWKGVVSRISPEAPVPIVKINTIIDQLGGAANVAGKIAALGAESRLLGLIGTDESADCLKKKLSESHIIWNLIPVDTYSTVVKLRVMSCDQQLIRLDFEEDFSDVDTNKLFEQIELNLQKCNILVLSDYNKGSLNNIREIIKLARTVNVPIIIDPKGTQFSQYTGATLLTPNMSEFEAVVGYCHNESIVISRAKELMVDYDLSALLITRSEQGMTLLQKNKELSPLYFPAQSKEVYDVTGAGDTVVGVLSAALSVGRSLETACVLASVVVGTVIKSSRVSSVVTTNINNENNKGVIKKRHFNSYERINVPPFGILDEDVLVHAISFVQNRGGKVVMTNGVFDILHSGHISYLSEAKKLGDKLIVAVNSDDSTSRLKGRKRPINTLEDRMLVLSALSVVDWVVPFYEDTPKRLIEKLSPDFLVKGGDYQMCDIEGVQSVVGNGGEVRILDFKDGYSSSNIIDNIIKDRDSKK